jgi:hypothetical protein
LPRHLLFAILAYRIQADRSGDLDHETRQLLASAGSYADMPPIIMCLGPIDL